MSHWVESCRRQRAARTRLSTSSLPIDRFEGWALDLIVDALVRDEHARETRRSSQAQAQVQVLPSPRDS